MNKGPSCNVIYTVCGTVKHDVVAGYTVCDNDGDVHANIVTGNSSCLSTLFQSPIRVTSGEVGTSILT